MQKNSFHARLSGHSLTVDFTIVRDIQRYAPLIGCSGTYTKGTVGQASRVQQMLCEDLFNVVCPQSQEQAVDKVIFDGQSKATINFNPKADKNILPEIKRIIAANIV